MASLISPIIGLINRISFINRVSSPVGKPFLNFFPNIYEERKKLLEEELWIQLYSSVKLTILVL